MKTPLISISISALALTAAAAIPDGYYNSLDGKQGDALIEALETLAGSHTVITYNTKTWEAFEKTDVRRIAGREAWWDMYSNNLVWLPAHDALNIEHSVANSWWGGKKGNAQAYADLFHLNPSDQNANNKKGSYPPGEVADARLLDNGLLLIGTPVEGMGGGAASVFEPADEYKGDFARAYFYIFTAYPEIGWDSEYAYVYGDDRRLQPWAAQMLLRWSREDPVDSKEISRNEEIFRLQNNRNPFIDYPELAEHIWGTAQSSPVSLADLSPSEAIDRPEAPAFGDARMTGVNTYSKRWWDGFPLTITMPQDGVRLMLSIDGRDYFEPLSEIYVDPVANDTESHIYRAYVVDNEAGDLPLRSSVATLTVTALNPEATDYSCARWERVTRADSRLDDGYYVLLSSNTLHALGAQGGSTATQFMPSAGFVEFDASGCITEIPADAAIMQLQPLDGTGADRYRISVSDTRANHLGYWNCTAKNKMRLSMDVYTPGAAAIGENDEFVFTFDDPEAVGFGTLQFNKTQPRFLNYSSKQTPVYLYRFAGEGGPSGIAAPPQTEWAVGIEGNNIIAPAGTLILDINGRRVDGAGLMPGIYLVCGPGKTVKIRI